MVTPTINGTTFSEDNPIIHNQQMVKETGMGTRENLRGDLLALANIRLEMFDTYWGSYERIWNSTSMSARAYGAKDLASDTTPNEEELLKIFDKHTLKNIDVQAHKASFEATIKELEQTASAAMDVFIKNQGNHSAIVQEIFGIRLRGIVTVKPTPVGLNFEVWTQEDANEISRAYHNLEKRVQGEKEFEGQYTQYGLGFALSGNFNNPRAGEILSEVQRHLLPRGITVVNHARSRGLNNEDVLKIIRHEVFHQFNLLYSPEESNLSEDELMSRLTRKMTELINQKMLAGETIDADIFINNCLRSHALLVRQLAAKNIRDEMLAQASSKDNTWESIAKEIKRFYLNRFSPIRLTGGGYKTTGEFTEKQSKFITELQKSLREGESGTTYSEDFAEKAKKSASEETTMQELYKLFDPDADETVETSWYKEILEYVEYAEYIENQLGSREKTLAMLYSVPLRDWDVVAKLFAYKS